MKLFYDLFKVDGGTGEADENPAKVGRGKEQTISRSFPPSDDV